MINQICISILAIVFFFTLNYFGKILKILLKKSKMIKFFKQLFCSHVFVRKNSTFLGYIWDSSAWDATKFEEYLIEEECCKCGIEKKYKKLKFPL